MRMPLFYLASTMVAGTYGLTFVIPSLFEQIGGTEADVGNVFAIIAIATITSLMFSGYWTNKLGHMVTISISSLVAGLSLYLFAIAREVGLVTYLAGGALGAGYALFYTLTPVVIAHVTDATSRIRAFTLFSVAIMVGLGLAPVLNYYLIANGHQVAQSFELVAISCWVSAVIFAGIARMFPSSGAHETRLSLKEVIAVFRSRAGVPILMVGLGASVFAGVTNFQVVLAKQNGLQYSDYFLMYTAVVVLFRVFFSTFTNKFKPYRVMCVLLIVMTVSVCAFLITGENRALYLVASLMFGLGYGVSYPIVKATASLEADPALLSQTMQLFGLAYFVGVFGFPFIAGWVVFTSGMKMLLILAAFLAGLEAFLAYYKGR
ncbi:MAG: MFS transporter [Proteobacteria bacterium]|nr:MFS transporter [Pseudomonadota bacterium]